MSDGTSLRVALAQVNPTVGDLAGNADLVREWIGRARQAGAELVVFPEMVLTGYPPEDLVLRTDFLRGAARALAAVAAEARDIVALVGTAELADDVHNSAAVLADGRVAGFVRKTKLPNYGVFDEERYFAPGLRPTVLRLGELPVSVTVCEDLWVPDGPLPVHVRDGGALVAVNLSASPYHRGKGRVRRDMLRTRATDHQIPLVFANLVGGQDELVFDGGSLVLDESGRVVAEGPVFEEALILAELDLGLARRSRLKEPRGRRPWNRSADGAEARPAVRAIEVERPEARTAFAAGVAPLEAPGDLETIYRALVTGLRDYVQKNGFPGVIVALSGGIDSALTVAVAVDALGAERVLGVTMPSRYSSEGTRGDAVALADNLGIRLHTIPIEPIFERFLEGFDAAAGPTERDVTEENLQARIRGTLVMALSNKLGLLLLTTGNKSELAMGYCTLYGDMAGGFAVIKDIPKTLVFELSRHRNARGPGAPIPESTITRPPSAELREDQKDEDSLPPYEVLDPILAGYVEEDRSIDELVAAGHPEDLVRSIARAVDRNEYKRRQSPPGVRITPKAFGKDRRMPITNRWTRD